MCKLKVELPCNSKIRQNISQNKNITQNFRLEKDEI